VAWPSAADFSEAVQSPRTAFRDGELQLGQIELNSLQLPKPRSGGFAVVFKLQSGPKDWAVKCFTRDFADQRQRYDSISRHLAEKHLSYIVPFEYLREGIKVRGQMYPILKMKWVEGENLREYVERHLRQPQILRNLAAQWATMLSALHAASIAHGDLQDRNVIVVNDAIQLIDYDGMFVPSLHGNISHELGARNYQHPLRTERDFGPYLDNFSAWVVYLSLIGLAAEPELWRKFGLGDERLIFDRSDYDEPSKSEVLKVLENCFVQDVRSVAKIFRSLIYLRLSDIPFLDELIDLSKSKSAQVDASSELAMSDPAWILEGLAERDSVSWAFEHSPVAERIVLASSLVAGCLVLVLWYLGSFAYYVSILAFVLASIGDSIFLIARFFTDGAVKAARPLRAKAREASSARRTAQRDLDQAAKKSLKIRQALKDELSKIEGAHHSLRANEQEEKGKVQTAIENNLNQLRQRIRELDNSEATEIANTLGALQRHHVDAWMARTTLANAQIPGIGEAFKFSLLASGYRTAVDIDADVERIPGIGPARRHSLMFWRQQVESQARASAPTALARNEETAIRTKYAAPRKALNMQADAMRGGLAAKEREIRDAFKLRNEALVRRAALARHHEDEELKKIDHQTEDLRKALFRINWDSAKLDRDLLAIKNIHFLRYVSAVFFLTRRARGI
jgi:predicted Ser/Thr protein kinase